MTPAALSALILDAFTERRPQIPNERALCDALERVLAGLGGDAASCYYSREHRLGARDRPDFAIDPPPHDGRILAVEVKVKGSLADLTRQVFRYAEHDQVSGILVVTTRADHRRLPETILDRPVAVCYIGSLYL